MVAVIVGQFMSVLEMIPQELTHKIKALESDEFEGYEDKALIIAKELKAYKKAFFYRRKNYRDNPRDEKAVSKYMVLVHDILIYLAQLDKRMEKIFEDES